MRARTDHEHQTPPVVRSRRSFLGLAGRSGALGAALTAGAVAVPGVARAEAATTPGVELGYAETVSAASTKASTAIPNLALSVTQTDAAVAIEYGGYVMSSVSGGLVKLYLLRDGVPVHEVGCTVAGAGGVGHLHGLCRIAPTRAGTSVYTVLLANWSSNATVWALAMPLSPAFIQARTL